MNKVVKRTIFAVLSVLLLTITSFYVSNKLQEKNIQGKLVFAKSYDAGSQVNRVVITDYQNTVELRQNDGYWRLPGYHDYYADFNLVKSFFDTLNSSTYLQPVSKESAKVEELSLLNPQNNNHSSGILVQTYADDELLDAIIIGMKDSDNGFFIARRADSDNIWLIGGNYDIPCIAKLWLPKSILDIPAKAVEMLGVDGHLISRRSPTENFYDRLGLAIPTGWLLQTLSSLNITDVITEKMFNDRYAKADISKIYDINTFYGLRFELDFYETSADDVWVNIKLSSDTVALRSVNDYINDNAFLYEGWYFKIAPYQKEFLMNYKLM